MVPIALKQVCLAIYHVERFLIFTVDRGSCSTIRTDYQLKKLNADVIEQIVRQYSEDTAVLNYIKRASRRLTSSGNAGYVLCSQGGEFVSFAWAGSMDGYHVTELGIHLEGRRILIFDCYTPAQHRRKTYYSTTLKLVVEEHRESKDRVVILSSAENPASVKGIVNAGFVQRFAIDTKVIFGRVWAVRRECDHAQS